MATKAHKPDQHIYRLACKQLGVTPRECLYIGDSTGGKLAGTLRLGTQTVQIHVDYEDPETLALFDREDWQGPVITSLAEVPGLLESPARQANRSVQSRHRC